MPSRGRRHPERQYRDRSSEPPPGGERGEKRDDRGYSGGDCPVPPDLPILARLDLVDPLVLRLVGFLDLPERVFDPPDVLPGLVDHLPESVVRHRTTSQESRVIVLSGDSTSRMS